MAAGISRAGGRNRNVSAATAIRVPMVMALLVMTSSIVIRPAWTGVPAPGPKSDGCPG